jgi:hypothetical protein
MKISDIKVGQTYNNCMVLEYKKGIVRFLNLSNGLIWLTGAKYFLGEVEQ